MSHSAKDVVRQWFSQVWEKKDAAAVDRLVHPDFVVHGMQEVGPNSGGIAQFKQFHAIFTSTYSDIKITIDDIVEEGDRVAWRLTCRSTHSGAALGVPPTGKRICSAAMGMSRIRNGKILEMWLEFDRYGMFQQIGVS